MPAFASKKQYAMFQAILHGKADPSRTQRGDIPPKGIADKYTGDDKDLPESKGKELDGGFWSKESKGKHHARVQEARNKKKVKKNEGGSAVIALNKNNQILMGLKKGEWCLPGGKVEPRETYMEAARRELEEETGLQVGILYKVGQEVSGRAINKIYETQEIINEPLAKTQELSKIQWFDLYNLPWSNMRWCSKISLGNYIHDRLNKSTHVKDMVLCDYLKKNVVRPDIGMSFASTHGDSLRFVGTGLFRYLKKQVEGMEPEGLKTFNLDTLNVNIRKHANDCYSGKIMDGHKQVHEFANRSLPEITTEIMSIMEYPLDPDDAGVIDDSIDDKDIKAKLQAMIKEYKQNSISNIYDEVNNIRQEMRNGTAVDLQQIEGKLLKLIEELKEEVIEGQSSTADRMKNMEMQLQFTKDLIASLIPSPPIYGVPTPQFRDPSYMSPYANMSRPTIAHLPNKMIRIIFNKDWSPIKKSEFLKDANLKKVERL